MKPVKCAKVKNPCKICFQTVQPKNGLQCQGACKKWAHFKCLGYTPGKIQDIKAGLIKINCPCPDCDIDPDKKEVLTKPPFTCAKKQCPANKKPICEAFDCPKKLPPCPGSGIDPDSLSCPEDCPSDEPPPCCPPKCPPKPCPPPRCCPGKTSPPRSCSPPSSAKKKKRRGSPPRCPEPACPPPPCPPPPCSPPPCPPSPCSPPPCPPPPCPPDPCRPACAPPKPPCPAKPPCSPPPPPCPPKPANCPLESCRHYLAEMAEKNKCTKSKCMVSTLEIPEQNCIKASQSYITNLVASHASIVKPTRSDSELVTGKRDEAKARIMSAMDEMCHTVGLFHNQFKDLMGRMMIALDKC